MRFTATEAGLKDGIGGASNSKSSEKHHYILFSVQDDVQHPENSGVYFEYDDQSNGAVNSVTKASIGDRRVSFKLKSGKTIEISCNVSKEQWEDLERAIRNVFPKHVVK